jgi:hypothetical protein
MGRHARMKYTPKCHVSLFKAVMKSHTIKELLSALPSPELKYVLLALYREL